MELLGLEIINLFFKLNCCTQAATLKRYDAPLSLTTLICFVGTLQAIVVTFVMERRTSVWRIGFDMNLLAAAYAVSLSPLLPNTRPNLHSDADRGISVCRA